MDRRDFMRAGGLGTLGAVSAAGLAMPALAQTPPKVRWRCQSAFPPRLGALHGGAVRLAAMVRAATDGGFEIEVLAPDETAPLTAAMDAVTAGTVDMAHTAAGYSFAKDPVFGLAGAAPFTLNVRGLHAWLYQGEGLGLLQGFFAEQQLAFLPGGSTGTQMGGWYRREVKGVQDLSGLNMRIGGLGGEVLKKLGVVPQDLPPAAIYAALERGALDAAEWMGPQDDEALGFVKVAPYYYYPGWWEGSLSLAFLIGKPKHDALPPAWKSVLSTAARAVSLEMLAEYDFKNPPALKRLVEAGAQLRPFPQDVLNACFDAATTLYGEISGGSAAFKKIHDSLMAFRNETYLYQQVAEYTFDTFMMIKQREGALSVAADNR